MTATPLAVFALTDRPEWLDQRGETAVCAQTDPELWFPEKGGSAREAKRLCRSCPFLSECREWALARPLAARHGVWGGLSEQERRAELKRRAGQASPATADAAASRREAA